ncbi:plant UBX domain-containing protein 8-like isoform X3 [Phaseolus vulgaris]|uniref:plant UBX domain-containing protein 8-like isoform X3 n=1 Tax=Phaseolus vulgaris TaxID=3885 RepID=UPI0035CBB1D6
MATPEAVAAFRRITGAPEFVAVQKLEAYGGNLNEAINAHFLEGDRHILSGQGQNLAAAPQHNNIGASNQNRGGGSNGILPLLNAARRFRPSLLLDSNYRRELRDLYKGIGDGGATAYTNRPPPAWTNSPFEPHYQSGLSSTEEAMLQAAIEASKMERRGGSSWERIDVLNDSSDGGLPQTLVQQEDDDLARAIASSLETAEQEKTTRQLLVKEEKEGQLGVHFSLDKEKKTNSSRNQLELGTSSDQNVAQDVAPPVIGHLSNNRAGGRSQHNEDVFLAKKWGGISAEEINEALLVETSLFGEISTHSFPSLPNIQHRPEENMDPKTQDMSTSMSQLLINTRLLKQQQDADYLASLQADKQKELNSFNKTESHSSQEEESCKKMLEKKELVKKLDTKELRLSKEPLLSDEVITIVVRMPDGGRCERRFLKTDKLELLFEFIDACGAQKPGTYRFHMIQSSSLNFEQVRSYPRRAYSINDCLSTFNEVGLNKSNEALFLELI